LGQRLMEMAKHGLATILIHAQGVWILSNIRYRLKRRHGVLTAFDALRPIVTMSPSAISTFNKAP
jgi:hypothetical protein